MFEQFYELADKTHNRHKEIVTRLEEIDKETDALYIERKQLKASEEAIYELAQSLVVLGLISKEEGREIREILENDLGGW